MITSEQIDVMMLEARFWTTLNKRGSKARLEIGFRPTPDRAGEEFVCEVHGERPEPSQSDYSLTGLHPVHVMYL